MVPYELLGWVAAESARNGGSSVAGNGPSCIAAGDAPRGRGSSAGEGSAEGTADGSADGNADGSNEEAGDRCEVGVHPIGVDWSVDELGGEHVIAALGAWLQTKLEAHGCESPE